MSEPNHSVTDVGELLPNYDFTAGERGKHHRDYQRSQCIRIPTTDSKNPIMQTIKERPHVSISSDELADWLAAQPEDWWFIDGDPVLIYKLYTPAPGDELADALRTIKKRILIFDRTEGSTARGEPITADRLEQLADRDNNHNERVFLCCWEDSERQWLLAEDMEEARLFKEAAEEALSKA